MNFLISILAVHDVFDLNWQRNTIKGVGARILRLDIETIILLVAVVLWIAASPLTSTGNIETGIHRPKMNS